MAKFDLKKAILENKATFFSSLNEGQFSWMTQDTGQQIGSQDENKIPVYMFDDKGKYYYENDYDGYGEFGGKDYYDLVAEMNGYTADDAEELGGMFNNLRGIGVKLAFGELEPKNGGPVLFPALVTKPDKFNYKSHNFAVEAETDPNQSWYEPEEDEEDNSFDLDDDENYGYNDEDEEELDENKEVKPTTKMKKSDLKNKIKEMILNEMEDEKVVDVNDETPESEEDFLAELEGMLNEAEGLTPLQDYVYQYEIEISGEDEAQEFLDDIRKLKTPDDVYDYYADKRGWKGSMDNDLKNIYKQVKRKFSNLSSDDLTPLQRRAYSYTKERFGDEEAKNSLDQIKTLKTGQEFTNWVNQKLKSLSEASEFDTNKPARIAAFIKDLDALVDEYHAELYLFGDVLDAIEMVKKAANEEMNLNEAEGDKHVVMKGNKFYTGTEFVDDIKDAMKYNLKSATEIAKEKKGMVYTPKAVKEAKKDEEVEDEVNIDIESPEPMDTPMGGINVTQNADADLTGTEKEVQDNLEAAMEAAKKLGDEKLSSQIGNTLTFFTRQHVVKENLKETLLFQKRAGIITETQYKQKLNEISEDEDEVPLTSKVKSFINKAIADSKKDGEFEELKKADWFENELIDELIDLFPNKDYDSASSEVMDYIKDKIK